MEDRERRAREIQEAIRHVLLHEWDPLGVSQCPEAQDEYDSYVSGVYRLLASGASVAAIDQHVGIHRRDVAAAFHVMGSIIKADLSKSGSGIFKVPGLMRITVKRKPATKERQGINPFTKEPTIFKAKPARNVVRVRPLQALKAMV